MTERVADRPERATPRPEPGPLRTFLVAVAVAAACSVLVTAASVLSAPLRRESRERERRAHLEALVARQPGLRALLPDGAADLEEVVVDLASGAAVRTDLTEPGTAEESGAPLPPGRDLAGIGRRPRLATAYLVRSGPDVALVLLPVHGRGYGGTIRGYVAVSGDANTVAGLSFYEHSETPGVGGEVLADEEFLAAWRGKSVRDASGVVRIGISSGEVDPRSEEAAHLVDAVSGATVTAGGVANLLRFWLGEDGFGPFLVRLAEGRTPR